MQNFVFDSESIVDKCGRLRKSLIPWRIRTRKEKRKKSVEDRVEDSSAPFLVPMWSMKNLPRRRKTSVPVHLHSHPTRPSYNSGEFQEKKSESVKGLSWIGSKTIQFSLDSFSHFCLVHKDHLFILKPK